MFSQSEIKAITKLLRNPDESTTKLLQEQLETFDTKTLREINNEIPLDDINLKKQFLDLASRIKREQLKKDFSKWSKSHSQTLEEGVFMVALFENPGMEQRARLF